MLYDEFPSTFESLIEIKCPDDGLKGIGEDIRIFMSLRIVLTTRDLYRVSKLEPMSDLCEIATPHQC